MTLGSDLVTGPDKQEPIKRDGEIRFPGGTSLRYEKIDGNGFVFNYQVNGDTIRLNDYAPRGFSLVPVQSNFFTRLTIDGAVPEQPMVDISIARLKEDETAILAAFHELGHADHYEDVRQQIGKLTPEEQVAVLAKMRLPRGVSLDTSIEESYAAQLVRSYLIAKRYDDRFEKADERRAWAFALSRTRELGVLQRFPEAQRFYRQSLRSYQAQHS